MSPYTRQWGPNAAIRIGPPGPIPPAVLGLLIANFAIYLLDLATGTFLLDAFALVPARVLDLELWRLFTYQFLHAGVLHLAINSLMLWMFGAELEQRWGARFFLRYYFLCGIAGGVAFTLVALGSGVPTVGASGAIYGILMAYGMWFPNRQVLVALLFPLPVKHLVALLMALEFFQTLESSTSGIAHAAHLGGAAFGYLYLRRLGAAGLDLDLPRNWSELRRRYRLWRLRRLQRRRFGDDRTLH